MTTLFELGNQPQILVIDDEADNFDVIEALLHNENYKLSYAASGQAGLEQLAKTLPDVILLDVMMPHLDGIEVCQRIKQNAQWQHIPIVMVTALSGKENLAKCMGAGANDFISKPVNGLELRARVRSMVQISQQYQNIQQLCQRVQAGNEHLESFNKMLEDDVQERTAQLQKIVYQDTLTPLASRASLIRHLQKIIQGRANNSQAVLFYLDCDNFQLINNSWGYEVGNQLLVAIADRLKTLLQPTDFLARLGADEFCFARKNILGLSEVKQLANDILTAFHRPFHVADRNIFITASLGIALDHPRYQQAEQLVHDADLAMQRAKSIAPGRHHAFDVQMQEDVQERLQLQQALYYALAKRELVVDYQPIIDLSTGAIHSLEAQVTWHHPQRGQLLAAEFLPYMEETGLSIPVGLMVLRQACQQLQTLQKNGWTHITIQVPLSVKQFAYPHLLKEIEQLLTNFAIDPQRLALDISESAISQNPAATDIIKHLRSQRLQININNFGAESSSLQNLQQIVVDNIKIDHAFLPSSTLQPRSIGIIAALVQMAQTLNITVTATGIEHQAQLLHLRELGCDFGQGNFCGTAIEAAAVLKSMNNNVPALLK